MGNTGAQYSFQYPWEEDEGALAEEVADGEAALAEAVFKGRALVEVGEPFEDWRFDTRKWWKPAWKKYRASVYTPEAERPPMDPKNPPEPGPEVKRTLEDWSERVAYPDSICRFCGRKHPTKSSILECMSVTWGLFHVFNRRPTQEDVGKALDERHRRGV